MLSFVNILSFLYESITYSIVKNVNILSDTDYDDEFKLYLHRIKSPVILICNEYIIVHDS